MTCIITVIMCCVIALRYTRNSYNFHLDQLQNLHKHYSHHDLYHHRNHDPCCDRYLSLTYCYYIAKTIRYSHHGVCHNRWMSVFESHSFDLELLMKPSP